MCDIHTNKNITTEGRMIRNSTAGNYWQVTNSMDDFIGDFSTMISFRFIAASAALKLNVSTREVDRCKKNARV
jgi:hypothetical protein